MGITEHKVTVGAVAALVGCIFPDFTYYGAFTVCLLFYGLPHLPDKAVRQLIRHIEPEARSTS